MSTDDGGTESRAGVRSNALSAPSFSRLRIVDSRVSAALLDVLEDAGVAAYVEPSAGDVGPYREVRAHRTPSDQLYVDSAARATANAVIDAELPGMLAEVDSALPDDDDAFAAIVAGFDAEPTVPTADWPAAERTTAQQTDTAEHDDEWYMPAPIPREEDDERYIPPPPPPLPRLSGRRLWGVLALVGGVLLMFLLPLADIASNDAIVIGVVVMAAGAAILISQMRDGPRDSDSNDGAVV